MGGMVGLTGGQIDGQKVVYPDKRMDVRMDNKPDRKMDRQMDEKTDERTI